METVKLRELIEKNEDQIIREKDALEIEENNILEK